MKTQVASQARGKRSVAGWIAAGVAALAISAVGSYQPSVLESIKIKGTHFVGDRTSDSQILMADGTNGKPGGG
jgi:phage-related tail protein